MESLLKVLFLVPLLAVRRMYHEATRRPWNPFVGCEHDCLYCRPSFQALTKRAGEVYGCEKCIRYEPHFHPERLDKPLPRTGPNQFIFTCDCGDICFAKPEWVEAILARVKREPKRTFLIQSKNPAFFQAFKWPPNVILATTLETDREELTSQVSKAPPPVERYKAMKALNHPRKIVTVEPIMDFNFETFTGWIMDINPLCAYIGYNSRNQPKLPEPPRVKTESLIKTLEANNIPVRRKLIRKAWNEA